MNAQLPLNIAAATPVEPPTPTCPRERPLALPAPERGENEDETFRWGEDESTLVPEQQAVAAYFNAKGALVIRQERTWDQDEDSFVIIAGHNVEAFVDRLTRICSIPEVGGRG